MLAERKTLPLWRRRRPKLLEMERALGADPRTGHNSDSERNVIDRRRARRRASDARGRIRPPT